MRLFIAIVICKLTAFIGSLFGKGSSLPGKVALWLYPRALHSLMLPGIIIAVTGSNGKTSTAQFITFALRSKGMKVGWNREGSNQTEGIATLLLRIATLRGDVKYDALVLECDERYAAKIFSQIKPSSLVVTNICRDQLTRNGHHEFISDCLREAISITRSSTNLVLNADDPYVAALAEHGRRKVMWYGLSPRAKPLHDVRGMYDDGAFCPRCKARMDYDYRIAAHFGGFNCKACGFSHPKAEIEITHFDYASGELVFAGQSFEESENAKLKNLGLQGAQSVATVSSAVRTQLRNPSLGGAYNMAAALAAARTAGMILYDAARCLSGYELTGGRTMNFPVGRRDVMLLICKHENSLAYNLAMAQVTGGIRPCSIIILVNSISRRYYTSDTSWLWDIDFDVLTDDCVKDIVLAGQYAGELMTRFSMSAAGTEKCRMVTDLTKLRSEVNKCATDSIYVLTCFADKARLLKELGVRS